MSYMDLFQRLVEESDRYLLGTGFVALINEYLRESGLFKAAGNDYFLTLLNVGTDPGYQTGILA
jgi:hypothetical protein